MVLRQKLRGLVYPCLYQRWRVLGLIFSTLSPNLVFAKVSTVLIPEENICEIPVQLGVRKSRPKVLDNFSTAEVERFEKYFTELALYVVRDKKNDRSPSVPHDLLNRATPSQLEFLYHREEDIMKSFIKEEPGTLKAADIHPHMNVRPERRAKQITGFLRRPGQLDHMAMEIADGFLYETADGKILLMGSGQNYIEYPNLDHLLKRLPGTRKAWDLRYPDGTKIQGPYHTGELPWDLNIVRWEDGTEVMYGGAMTPPKFRRGSLPTDAAHANILVDNWSRSGHAFAKKYIDGEECWVMMDHDLFGHRHGTTPTWRGHNYGRRVITDSMGRVWRDHEGYAWLIYDKVYDDTGDVPRRTKLFARRMKNQTETVGPEISLVDESELESSMVERGFGRHDPLGRWVLLEGGNPFTVTVDGETFHGLAASGNDFPTDRYPTLVGFRKASNDTTGGRIGAYQFLKETTSEAQWDLKDLAQKIRTKYKISWGPGRPYFFQDRRGDWWLLAHGIDLTVLPEGLDGRVWPPHEKIQFFHRNQYIFPVKMQKIGDTIVPVILD
jgi:hypothetical protein